MIKVYQFKFPGRNDPPDSLARRYLPGVLLGDSDSVAPAWSHGLYRLVANVATDELEVAWRVTNSVDQAWFLARDARVTIKAPLPKLRSSMVGDVFLSNSLIPNVAAMAGFRPLIIECPDCGVEPGELHDTNCDVERCGRCGGQRFSCGCISSSDRMPWTGTWPGVIECQDLGWYARLEPGKTGWHTCDQDDPGAHEDLNRLAQLANWDRKTKRWVI